MLVTDYSNRVSYVLNKHIFLGKNCLKEKLRYVTYGSLILLGSATHGSLFCPLSRSFSPFLAPSLSFYHPFSPFLSLIPLSLPLVSSMLNAGDIFLLHLGLRRLERV